MTQHLPSPLTPSDLDLRDFAYMPVDIGRLFGSQFHALASDAEWRAGMTLWLKSYHQVPGASVPDDDVALARLAEFGRDTKGWRKVRLAALRGWVKCSDGRLYHPVVAEKALEGWIEKLRQRKSSGAGNAKRWGTEFDPTAIDAAMASAAAMLRDINPQSRSLAKRIPPGVPPASHRDKGRMTSGYPDRIPDHSQEKGKGSIDDAETRARPGPDCGISQQAFDVTDALEKAFGFNLPEDVPPGWAGCALWVQKCLNEGWEPQIMIGAGKVIAKRARRPIMSFAYLEKPMAEFIAEHRKPLPTIEDRQPEKITVIVNGKSESLAGVAARLAESGVTFGERPRGLRLDEGGDNVRLLSKG